MPLLTLFKPKRSASWSIFLILGCIACSNPVKEISGTYETVVSTTSEVGLDTLASYDTLPSDSSAESSDSELSSPESSDSVSFQQEASDAASSERTLLLELHEDQRAEFKTNFLDKNMTVIQKGSWALLDNSRIRIYFVEKDGQFFRDTLTFHRDGLRLVLRGARSSIMDEVSLMRVIEP